MKLESSRHKGQVGAAIALALSLVYSTVAFAQSTSEFGPGEASMSILSDPVTYATLNPGETFEGTIKVRNGDTADHLTFPKIRDWLPGKDPGSVVLLEQGKNEQATEPSPYPLAAFTTVSPAQQIIKSKQEFEFSYKITMPDKNLAPGGHYGAIGFSFDNSANAVDESGVAISPRLYKLFFVTVPGDIRYAAKIVSFLPKRAKDVPLKETITQNTQNLQLTTTHGYKFVTVISNEGNVHFRPRGFHINIHHVFGGRKDIDIPDAAATKLNVLPRSQRTFTTNWPNRLKPGYYLAKVEFLYGDDNGPFLRAQATKKIIVMPPWWWWLILILILIVTWVLTRSRKRIRRAYRAFREG